MPQELFKSGDDVTHLMDLKSGDDVTHLMNPETPELKSGDDVTHLMIDTKETPKTTDTKLDTAPMNNDKKPLVIDTTPDKQDTKPESKGILGRAWDWANTPLTDLPSRFADSVANYIDSPSVDRSPTSAYLHGLLAGGIQGGGHAVTGLTTPLNLGTALATGGSSMAAKAGLPEIAGALSLAGKATGVPMIAHGARDVINPDSPWSQRGTGLMEIAGGLGAMMGGGSEKSPTVAEEPPIQWNVKPPTKETGLGGVKPALNPEVAAATPVGKGSTNDVKVNNANKAVDASADSGFVDPHAQYRAAPVGTTFTFKNLGRNGFKNLTDLGYKYKDANADGSVIFEKVKDSNPVKEYNPKPFKSSNVMDAMNAPRTLLASMDFSAPLRQGIGLIHKKEFWTSLDDMFKAAGSEEGYNQVQQSIRQNPMFQKTVDAKGNIKPSFAEKSGLKLTDLHGMATREESMMSKLAESVPGVRASNRAYTAFINKLRADSFTSMINDMKVIGVNGKTNTRAATQIADFVNTATGRGSLGKLEGSAEALSTMLFSPRLIASRLGMMAQGSKALFSPETYMMSQPSIRREYLKSLFAIAGVGGIVTTLGKAAGGTVETDPSSADFGKMKLGQTRIDPYAGFQQYIVAAQRLMPHIPGTSLGGEMKSTNTGIKYDLGNPKYGQSDRFDTMERFVRSKVNPIAGFAWSLLRNQRELDGSKMNFTTMNPLDNSIAQRFVPLVTQDIMSLIREEGITPKTATAGALSTFGMGIQEYKKQRPH